MTQAWKQWEGQVVKGEYPLRQYLGGSEHSAVFLTEDPKRGLEKVAIKLIPAGAVNAELQFSHWKAAAKLSHPHLIRLFEMGRCQLGDRDLLYVVMDHAEVDMSQILRRGPLPPNETRETFKLILEALAYLHGEGFIHGHLKPANLMGVDNQLKLSSDGLCRIGEPRPGRGTPGVYNPPEAASGTTSPAEDVWSLGITLVEALTQHPPARAATEEEEPPLPRTLPAPFLDIARNCLRREPDRRWTVVEIAARLERAAPAAPLPAPRPQIDSRPQKVFAKRRYIVPTAVVGLVLVLGVAGLKLMNRQHAEPRPDRNRVTRSTAAPAQKTSGKQQISSGSRPSHSSLGSGAAAKTPTGGAAEGGVQKKVLPDAPQSALDTIRGTIRVVVKVAVDPSGNVVDATLDYPGPSKYFARLSLEAARKWKFRPAEVDGQPVSKDWRLQFDFEKTGMQAIPLRPTPGG